MATNTWAEGVDKRTWADRRVTSDRRIVTHEDDGCLWGPIEALAHVVEVAGALGELAEQARNAEHPQVADKLVALREKLHTALGIPLFVR